MSFMIFLGSIEGSFYIYLFIYNVGVRSFMSITIFVILICWFYYNCVLLSNKDAYLTYSF